MDVVAVHPGYLSFDSVQQLGQALDPSTTTDWHPPVMTALWGLLLGLTGGSVGSMVVLQLGLLWAGLTGLAVHLARVSGRRVLSLLPLLLGTLPQVTAVSRVVWKDAQLAVALLAAVVFLLHVRWGPRRSRLRSAAVAAVVLLLAYAGAVRYDALPAIVPLLFLLTWPGVRRPRRTRALLGGAAIVSALMVNPLVGIVRPVAETHPAGSVMLDDVLHLYSPDELRSADVGPPLRRYLVTLATTCPPSTRDVNHTWRCANTTATVPAVLRTHADELRELYVAGIAERPLRYATFRLRVFGKFLVTPSDEVFVTWTTIDENSHGLRWEPNPVTRAREATVRAASEHAGALFEPWVWLLAALVVSGVGWRRRGSASHAGVVLALGLSAAAYVLAYLPVVIGYDYRFVYWPAVAVSVAAVLLLSDRRVRGEDAPTPGPEGGGLTLPPAPPAPDDRVEPAGPLGAAAPARPSSQGARPDQHHSRGPAVRGRLAAGLAAGRPAHPLPAPAQHWRPGPAPRRRRLLADGEHARRAGDGVPDRPLRRGPGGRVGARRRAGRVGGAGVAGRGGPAGRVRAPRAPAAHPRAPRLPVAAAGPHRPYLGRPGACRA